MDFLKNLPKLFVAHRLNIAAALLACILSLACLLKGAARDSILAVMLLPLPLILWVAWGAVGSLHRELSLIGKWLVASILLVLAMQLLLPPAGDAASLWQQVEQITGEKAQAYILYDQAAWIQSLGRLLFVILTFLIALCIGTSESAARIFLYSLLISGAACITLTFMVKTQSGVPHTTFQSYTHGFVNPNSAAAYLGIMLLIAASHAARFLRLPAKPLRKVFLEILDKLNVSVLLRGGFFLYAMLLSLAGLFMTGSRGGILVTCVGMGLFLLTIAMKMNIHRKLRKWVMIGLPLLVCIILVWSFMNFGHVTANKLQLQGVDSNSRLEIFSAVIPMITDHPLLGVGLGNFAAVFQQYRPTSVSADGLIDKAHNSYLEFAAEMGLPAFLLLLVMVGWLGHILYSGVKGRQERYVVPTLGLSVWAMIALYSLVDFPLQVPAIAGLVIALLTVCASQTDRRFSEPSSKAASTAPVRRVRSCKRRVM